MADNIKKPTKLLLHSCCAPCSLEPVREIKEHKLIPDLYYVNPNIQPRAEYDLRLETLKTWAEQEELNVVEGAYEDALWEQTVGRIGDAVRKKYGVIVSTRDNSDDALNARRARCQACYRMRFYEAAHYAANQGYTALGTTLSVSPYQYTEVIKAELERACQDVGIEACFEDYRPFYEEATRRSREMGMYRQNSCGCRFSVEEAEIERADRKAARARAKHEKRQQSAPARAQAEEQRLAEAAQKRAYQEKQARKKALLKELRAAAAKEHASETENPKTCKVSEHVDTRDAYRSTNSDRTNHC